MARTECWAHALVSTANAAIITVNYRTHTEVSSNLLGAGNILAWRESPSTSHFTWCNSMPQWTHEPSSRNKSTVMGRKYTSYKFTNNSMSDLNQLLACLLEKHHQSQLSQKPSKLSSNVWLNPLCCYNTGCSFQPYNMNSVKNKL